MDRHISCTLAAAFLLAPIAAFACEPPDEVSMQAPPPAKEKTVVFKAGGEKISIVPYSLAANYITYHPWKMDKECTPSEVPVYSFGDNEHMAREGGLACMGVRTKAETLLCMQQGGSAAEYKYINGALTQQQTAADIRQEKAATQREAREVAAKKRKDKLIVYSRNKNVKVR